MKLLITAAAAVALTIAGGVAIINSAPEPPDYTVAPCSAWEHTATPDVPYTIPGVCYYVDADGVTRLDYAH